MFGLSLGEIVLLLIVGIVVVGPKNLPTMMRTAGQWVTRLRRMSSDLRSQSGIDELIRHEGLEKEIQELRSLSRMNVVESLIAPSALQPLTRSPVPAALTQGNAVSRYAQPENDHLQPLREREYPLVGCDAGSALADDTVIYHHAPMAADAPAEEAAVEAPVDEAAKPNDDAPSPAGAPPPESPAEGPRGEASA
ncbi:MAG: Sec-independent protein translocase protein TatB [Minicystis sp.]